MAQNVQLVTAGDKGGSLLDLLENSENAQFVLERLLHDKSKLNNETKLFLTSFIQALWGDKEGVVHTPASDDSSTDGVKKLTNATNYRYTFIINAGMSIGRQLKEMKKHRGADASVGWLMNEVKLINGFLTHASNNHLRILIQPFERSRDLNLDELIKALCKLEINIKEAPTYSAMSDNGDINRDFFKALGRLMDYQEVTLRKRLLICGLFLGIAVGKIQIPDSQKNKMIGGKSVAANLNKIVGDLEFKQDQRPAFRESDRYVIGASLTFVSLLQNKLSDDNFDHFKDAFYTGFRLTLNQDGDLQRKEVRRLLSETN